VGSIADSTNTGGPTIQQAILSGSPGYFSCITVHHIYRTTATTTTVLQLFVQDYPGDRDYLGEPVPEEPFTHSPILVITLPLSASSIYYDP